MLQKSAAVYKKRKHDNPTKHVKENGVISFPDDLFHINVETNLTALGNNG
jgi:hypothetical protein